MASASTTSRKVRRFLRRCDDVARSLGFDLRKLLFSLRGALRFASDAFRLTRMSRGKPFPVRLSGVLPAISEDNAAARPDPHYFLQDIWAATRVREEAPSEHVDVGSRIDGFVAHLLTFREVTVVDIRPLDFEVPGLRFIQGDGVTLSMIQDGSVQSLSSLHAIEHFGLGRYGDGLNPDAWRLALGSFVRVLAPKGKLYLSVPIGRQRLLFNSHRVFNPLTIVESLSVLDLTHFHAIDDSGRLNVEAEPGEFAQCDYGCGLFEFEKS